jgi:hypothetical protein
MRCPFTPFPLALSLLITFPASSLADWAEDGVSICAAGNHQLFPAVVPDGTGGVIAAWLDERTSGQAMIFGQRVSSSGVVQWTPDGVAISSATAYDRPGMFLLAGGAVVAWMDLRNASTDVYAQRINASGLRQWAVDDVALIATSGNEQFVGLISDGTAGSFNPIGYFAAAFENNSGFADVIRLQRVDQDGAGLWTTAAAGGVVVASALPMSSVQMATDGVGSAFVPKGTIVAWTDFRAGSGGDIYAQHVLANGAVDWTPGGVPVCTLSSAQGSPAIANVSPGKTIIVWTDNREDASFSDIYGQMLDAGGNALWTGDGIVICNESGTQSEPKILRDGAGGAFVIWADGRTIPGPVLFGQHVDANGQRLWNHHGLPLSTVGKVEQIDTDHFLLPSGAGFIASWSDLRTSPSDPFAQRMDGTGARLWGNEARALCTFSGHSWDPVPAADGTDGVICVWTDNRNGNFDIFANRIPASGGGVDAPLADGAVPPFSLACPNPVRGATEITLHLPRSSHVTLEIFNVAGQQIQEIAAARWLEAGAHAFDWNGTDEFGAAVPAGIYFIRASALDQAITKRLVFLR